MLKIIIVDDIHQFVLGCHPFFHQKVNDLLQFIPFRDGYHNRVLGFYRLFFFYIADDRGIRHVFLNLITARFQIFINILAFGVERKKQFVFDDALIFQLTGNIAYFILIVNHQCHRIG
ncbi:hypothetical protein SDC9_130093 [bioreactor metagenome]|uniref:Uncharacterized protein n=1 Tax=bioreactor metagenome TaxID=1076179 RepID=A0A645D0J5_9ZZZZ